MGTTKEIEQLKKDFQEWSAFELNADDYQGILDEIKNMQNTLENEVFQKAKTLRQMVNDIFPDAWV